MTSVSEIRGKSRKKILPNGNQVLTTTRLHEIRQARGFGASDIARRVGISRQTIYAMESGDFVPNTAVALQLARVLETTVEELFSIKGGASESSPDKMSAELLATPRDRYASGELVRIGRVGSRTIAAPAPHFPAFLSDGDGVIVSQSKSFATIRPTSDSASSRNCLVVAGCDPALSLLSNELKMAGVEVITVPCSSREALNWLKKGLVHVAGTHLRDRTTGQYNVPLVTSLFGKEKVRAVTFAEWEQGFVVRRTNPKNIRSTGDLAGTEITIMNREKGSGAREVLDSHLRMAGIPPSKVQGYDRVAPSHMAAALSVANSEADCCIATVSAARCLGLDFLPLATERFDLIVATSEIDTVGIRSLFDVLNRSNLRRKLAMLAGYEVRHTGKLLM